MDIQVILQAISTVGFPIVVSAAMFWMVNKQSEQHKEEMDAVRASLDKNTLALLELKNAIERSDK